MAENSKIEWTVHTANIWHGCTKVHTGCDNCYAETLSNRWGNKVWGNDAPRKVIKSFYKDLDRYQKAAEDLGEVHRVFVGSMMDIFEKPMPVVGSDGVTILDDLDTGFIREIFFAKVSENQYPNLMFLLLTKRPSNINKYIPEAWKDNPPSNVMFGTSPVDQETANKLIPQLLQVNGRRFLSIEPMLGPIELNQDWLGYKWITDLKIDWIICGGESGHGRREFNPDWGRSLRNQCAASGVPFFFKQMDKVLPIPEDLMIRQFYKS